MWKCFHEATSFDEFLSADLSHSSGPRIPWRTCTRNPLRSPTCRFRHFDMAVRCSGLLWTHIRHRQIYQYSHDSSCSHTDAMSTTIVSLGLDIEHSRLTRVIPRVLQVLTPGVFTSLAAEVKAAQTHVALWSEHTAPVILAWG